MDASNCGWTPFNGKELKVSPFGTFVQGNKVVWDQKLVNEAKGQAYAFN